MNQIVVQGSDTATLSSVQKQIGIVLEQEHHITNGKDDFSVFNAASMIQTAEGVTQTLTMLLSGVAAVSLLVGGIGIMNIMLVSVTERTREIGIRTAVGARKRDILTQFLVEAVVLSGSGGVLGILLGAGASMGISRFAGWSTVIVPQAVVLAFGFAAAVGVFFGYYPARKASQLRPIEALRYE
ncbi:MAG: FtsX-like permease family protein [Mycolicibacterium sp.]|nr:FtsX-like permease family protein [Mycolicibacterium sp.]